jgi:hypothetical protein
LLHWGSLVAPRLAVIDGGPGNVYQNSLRPRLEEIRQNRGLTQLPIDLVMVSHADNDHVVGIKKLFRQLKSEVDNNVSALQRHFAVGRLWHNTFNDILGDTIDKFYTTLMTSVEASVGGNPNPVVLEKIRAAYKAKYPTDPNPDQAAFDIALLLAGHGEGRELRDSFQYLFDQQQINALNAPFKKNGLPTLITRGAALQPLEIGGLAFTILGPGEAEINALQEEFDAYIQEHGMDETSLLAAYADDSIKNLSSIVCLVQMGGRRMLLTGDARGDQIVAGLTAVGLLNHDPLTVDVLKVPHHGSDRNVEPDFFERIFADVYVFSGDGKHGNPERDTLTWLTSARAKSAVYDIMLTYPIAAIDQKREADAAKHKKLWNKATDSLEAFFEKRAQDGFQFEVHEGAPVKIDLGNERMSW